MRHNHAYLIQALLWTLVALAALYIVAVYILDIPPLATTGVVIHQEPKITPDQPKNPPLVNITPSDTESGASASATLSGTSSGTSLAVATGSLSTEGPDSLEAVFGTGTRESSGSLALYNTGSYHIYHNESLDYSFAMPNYSYYQGYGARDGALHTMAIALTASGIENIEDAPVQVYFYKKTPTNPPSDNSVVTPHGVVYVVASGAIDAKTQRIIDTVI